jgi:predicted RNA binding protein YcfA (HicA-like mRNA interferase family)
MSPRLPRDVSGPDLAKLLEAFGYAITRQKGSHLRLTTQAGGEHHVTVPFKGGRSIATSFKRRIDELPVIDLRSL